MSLKITTKLETVNGITIENAYGRVLVLNPYAGTNIQAVVAFYPTEQNFINGDLELKIKNVETSAYQAYDYQTGEKNILDLGHDILISSLAEQGVSATKML